MFSGTLKNIDTEIIRLNKHIFVGDTLDGGASVWFRHPNPDGEEIPRYREYTGDLPWDWPHTSTDDKSQQQKQDSVPLWCHCKGVQLRLHPGDYASKERSELPWFIDPNTNKRLASFDVCDSCRLQFTVDVVNWTFTDMKHISHPDGGVFPKSAPELKAAVDAGDPAVGSLAYYESSPDVQRFFCKTCCAVVFYACDDRPEIVDIAIGLLEAPDGARAESILSWTYGDTPTWIDDIKGGWRERLWKRVQTDAEEFRIARNLPPSWRRK